MFGVEQGLSYQTGDDSAGPSEVGVGRESPETHFEGHRTLRLQLYPDAVSL